MYLFGFPGKENTVTQQATLLTFSEFNGRRQVARMSELYKKRRKARKATHGCEEKQIIGPNITAVDSEIDSPSCVAHWKKY
jgi:hypothetical protein